jgi:Chitobiase/beta-hexosaminidase C-terminal domain
MAIVLTLEESEEQIISGFPEYITFETSVPANVFYTLDGTDPDEFSEIFVDKLYLPTSGTTLTLKAVAISISDTSSIIEKIYFTNQKKLDKTRLVGKEGINILPPGKTPVDNLSYNAAGDPAQETVIPILDLDLIGSTANNRGEDIPGDTTLDFVNFAKKSSSPEKYPRSSPNDNNINFDPKAAYIIIDGTTEEKIEGQIVRIINRPHGTMDLLSPIYARSMQNYQLNTANFVRYMINPISHKITFYYRDSRENRWIESTQTVGDTGLNFSPSVGPPNSFVFRWIENRSHSKIY